MVADAPCPQNIPDLSSGSILDSARVVLTPLYLRASYIIVDSTELLSCVSLRYFILSSDSEPLILSISCAAETSPSNISDTP